MGRYLRMAREHAERIKYYYDYAGPSGYQQAKYHFNQLGSLIGRASSSKNNKSDAVFIRPLVDTARKQMDEMAKRRDEWTREHHSEEGSED